MISVFSTLHTSRIEYTFRLIFESILNNEVQFYQNEEEFQNLDGIKINYSNRPELGGWYLQPYGLLHENRLQKQYPDIFDWEGVKAFYAVENSFLPFDLFSASFFLVSRYEEYLPGERDSHNRYMAKHSCAGKNGFLEKPLVNIWAAKLADIIEADGQGFKFERSQFNYIPSIDIDNAWAFKNKGFVRFTGSLLKDVLKRRWGTIKKRWAVINRKEKDPYDTYNFMQSVFNQYNFRPIYFFLLSRKGKYDRSLSHKNIHYRNLILRLGKKGKLGIHPSYRSNKSSHQLEKEIARMGNITGKTVLLSRQHFLKMSLPETYRRLIDQGIKSDYSMSFPSRPGFRASIACPYYFFDVLAGKTTSLKIYPFQVMDVTLMHYCNMGPTEALKKIKILMDETAKVGGTFISLWHNESLNNIGRWAGWCDVYTQMTAHAAELRNGNKTETSS